MAPKTAQNRVSAMISEGLNANAARRRLQGLGYSASRISQLLKHYALRLNDNADKDKHDGVREKHADQWVGQGPTEGEKTLESKAIENSDIDSRPRELSLGQRTEVFLAFARAKRMANDIETNGSHVLKRPASANATDARKKGDNTKKEQRDTKNVKSNMQIQKTTLSVKADVRAANDNVKTAAFASWPIGDCQVFNAAAETLFQEIGINKEGKFPADKVNDLYKAMPKFILEQYSVDFGQQVAELLQTRGDIDNSIAKDLVRKAIEITEEIDEFRAKHSESVPLSSAGQ